MILSEMFIHEYTDEERREVLAAKRRLRDDEKELLLQVQLMSYNTLIKDILAKVPTAKWTEFKSQTTYKGKIVYEADNGFAELWFRNDGMVVCSDPTTGKRSKCETDEKIFNWIAQHPALSDDINDTDLTGDMIDEISSKILKVFISNPIEKFKRQTKVVGRQTIFSQKSNDFFELWYRPSGEIFCKTPDGKFYVFNKLKQFERFLKANGKLRNAGEQKV